MTVFRVIVTPWPRPLEGISRSCRAGPSVCTSTPGPIRSPASHGASSRPARTRRPQPATILRIHSIISSALDLAVRYDWADRNVAKNASPPHPRKREPDPPSPDQAARLLNLVWAEDEEFGLYLWTAFTTGARHGEVSALRENRFDFKSQQVRLARNYLVKQGQHIEKAPKDDRVLSLDLLTCELFQHQLAEGAPPLLRYPAPGSRHRPEHRRRAPRLRGGLDDLEVLRPVHQTRRPARRRGHPLPARRTPQEGTPSRTVRSASTGV